MRTEPEVGFNGGQRYGSFLLLMVLLGSSLNKRPTGLEGFSVADATLVIASLATLLWRPHGVTLPGWIRGPALFAIASLLSSALLTSSMWWRWAEFDRSAARLILSLVGAVAVTHLVAHLRRDRVLSSLGTALRIFAALAIYATAAARFGFLPTAPDFVYAGSGVYEQFFSATAPFARTRGLASEPAVAALFMVTILGLLFALNDRRAWRRHTFTSALVAGAVLLTVSVVGYALLFTLGLCVLFLAHKDSELLSTGRRLQGAFFGTAVLALVILALSLDSNPLRGRLDSIQAGRDDSAVARVIASWDGPVRLFSDSPIAGAGLGNLGPAVEHYGTSLSYWSYLRDQPEGWNVIAYVWGTAGVLGVMAFLVLVRDVSRVSRFYFPVWLLSLFSMNGLLEPLFWVSLAILFGARPGRAAVPPPSHQEPRSSLRSRPGQRTATDAGGSGLIRAHS